MPYSAKAVANYFIDLAKKSGNVGDKTLTPMKIQKIVYFAHGWHLALTGEALIDEEIQAWKFGPVVNSLYHEFKQFGDDQITDYARTYNFDTPLGDSLIPRIPEDSPSIPILNRVWEVYGKYSGVQLSNATHQPNTPWYEIWEKEGKDKKSVGIPDSVIRDHFSGKLAALPAATKS